MKKIKTVFIAMFESLAIGVFDNEKDAIEFICTDYMNCGNGEVGQTVLDLIAQYKEEGNLGESWWVQACDMLAYER